MNSQILEKVEASGVCGIKKAELKKIFGTECDSSLDKLAKEEKIIVDNKGVAHYVWSKDNYLSHIQNDPKFKIISNLVKNLETSVNQIRTDLTKTPSAPDLGFQNHFDTCIGNLSSSLGWVPFSSIREKLCESLNISSDKFYSLSSSVVEENQSRYEVSTGGQEGIHVRGMLHGYVRRL